METKVLTTNILTTVGSSAGNLWLPSGCREKNEALINALEIQHQSDLRSSGGGATWRHKSDESSRLESVVSWTTCLMLFMGEHLTLCFATQPTLFARKPELLTTQDALAVAHRAHIAHFLGA